MPPATAARPPRGQAAKVRRSQEERSTTTKTLLLDAALDCLVDLGYAATTTTVIAQRAGVSRGAQLYHFPSRAALVSAAISHLAQKLGRELRVETRQVVDAPDRVAAAVDALWGRFRSRLFSAWLELWVAARTDSSLHAEVAVLEERIRQAIATQVHHLFGEGGADAATADQAYRATIYLMQGMALERSVGTADERTQRQSQAAALDLWKRVLSDILRPNP